MKRKGIADDNTAKSTKNMSSSKVNLMLKPITNFLSNIKQEDGSQTMRHQILHEFDPCLLLYNRGLKQLEEKSKKIKDKEEL